MPQIIKIIAKNSEAHIKLRELYKRLVNIFTLKFAAVEEFSFERISCESLETSLQVRQRLLQYELDKVDNLFRLKVEGGERHLKRALTDMGFAVNSIFNLTKGSDFSAVVNLEEPVLYKKFRRTINFVIQKFPFLYFSFPGLGRKRLHLRLFWDKAESCWIATAHIDETNVFHLSRKSFQIHMFDTIVSDYKGGTEMFNEMLLSYCE